MAETLTLPSGALGMGRAREMGLLGEGLLGSQREEL